MHLCKNLFDAKITSLKKSVWEALIPVSQSFELITNTKRNRLLSDKCCAKCPPPLFFSIFFPLSSWAAHSIAQWCTLPCKKGVGRALFVSLVSPRSSLFPVTHCSSQFDGMAHLLLPSSSVSSDVCSAPTCPCRPHYTATPGFIQLESVLPSVPVMFLVCWTLSLHSILI